MEQEYEVDKGAILSAATVVKARLQLATAMSAQEGRYAS